MESRKIQQVGERSFSVTLPKWWVAECKLKQHDNVFISKVSSGDLLISTSQAPAHRTAIEIHAEEVDSLPEFITLCYVKNVQRVHVIGVDYAAITEVKKTLTFLEGYAITHEDEHGIEISFMFGDINITTPVIIQRMVYLLKLSLSAVERQDQDSLTSFETSIDRLHNLSKRILGACMTDSALREANKITDQDTIFFLRVITKRLESIGDRVFVMFTHKPQKDEMDLAKKLLELLDRMLVHNEKVKKSKEDFAKLRGQVKSQNGLLRMYELAEDILEGHISMAYNKKYFNT